MTDDQRALKAASSVRATAQVIRPAAFQTKGAMPMLTSADIEAEYVDVLASISPKQLWAMQLYGTARALVAAERGSMIAGTPDEQRVAREMLFEAEAARRNAEAEAQGRRQSAN